jgi:hypothetical protein
MRLSAALARAAFFAVLTLIGIWLALSRSSDGPPPNDADLMLAPAAPPEHENAFLTLTSAAALLDMPADESEVARWRALTDGAAWDDALAASALARNERALAAFARAGRQTKLHSLSSPNDPAAARDVVAWLELSRLQALRTRALARSGHTSEAVAEALVSLRVARTIATDTNGSRLSSVLARAIAEPGLDALRAALAAGALPLADEKFLVHELAQLRANPNAWRAPLAGEYRAWATQLPAPPAGPLPKALALLPDAYRYQPNNTRAAFAERIRAEQVSLGERCEDRPAPALVTGDDWFKPNYSGRLLLTVALSHFTAAQARCVYDTRIESLRAALAVRQFEQARGTLPPSLAALAPDYLPEPPQDWFADGELRLDRAAREIVSFGRWDSDAEADPREERFPLLPAD